MSKNISFNPAMLPGDIESSSFAIIDSEVPEPRPFEGVEWQIVRRMIHTTADFEMLDLVRFHPDAVSAGLEALKSGCTIVTDTEMARMGIPLRRMEPLGCTVQCLMNDPRVIDSAKANGTTRALAAMDIAMNEIQPDIVVIGNAPTALIRLVKNVQKGMPAPKLVVGMPVGFVNAAESKEFLMTTQIPHICIKGRKGGSPVAACAINALAATILP